MVQGSQRMSLRMTAPILITFIMAFAAGCGASPPSQRKTSQGAPVTAGWMSADLRDVQSDQTFRLSDFRGRVVLVETMATWCRNCLRQQRELDAYLAQSGDGIEVVKLDVDPNEDVATLEAYARQYAFTGRYAIASRNLAAQLSDRFGDQVLNPSATPIIVIDKAGQAHLLPFGIKSLEDLRRLVKPYL